MAAPQIYNPVIPCVHQIPGGMYPGRMVRLQGSAPPGAQRFAINFQCGPNTDPRDDIALHLNFRFLERCVVRNHLTSMDWGVEDTSGGMPVNRGEAFEALILCEPQALKVALNGVHFCEFPHRLPFQRISHLTVDGDVMIQLIGFEGGQPPPQQMYMSQPPAYGQYGAPPPAYGAPGGFAPGGFAQPGFAQPVYGQPAYGQPAYGQPAYGQQGGGQQGGGQQGRGQARGGQRQQGQGRQGKQGRQGGGGMGAGTAIGVGAAGLAAGGLAGYAMGGGFDGDDEIPGSEEDPEVTSYADSVDFDGSDWMD